MIGERFTKLVVIEECNEKFSKRGKRYVCQCDCGNQSIVRSDFLKSGNTKSCGCILGKPSKPRATKERHGMSYSSEYRIYNAMKSRCYNDKVKGYEYYGGRGVIVCDRWLESFQNFYDDMGPRPNELSIDRINNDGNYEPDNCKWSNKSEQNMNRRK